MQPTAGTHFSRPVSEKTQQQLIQPDARRMQLSIMLLSHPASQVAPSYQALSTPRNSPVIQPCVKVHYNVPRILFKRNRGS